MWKRTLPLAGVLGIVLLTTKAAPQVEAVNGLAMSISHDEGVTGPNQGTRFIVTFTNLSSDDMAIAPGIRWGCDGMRPSKTSLISLNLADSRGSKKNLRYLGDGPPYQGGFCAGALLPFITVLHPGEPISLPLNLGMYLDLSDSKEYDEERLPAGTYSLQAELTSTEFPPNLWPSTPPIRARAWLGTVRSNVVHVHFDKEFGENPGTRDHGSRDARMGPSAATGSHRY
jgi:hypothetical protein